MNLFSARVTLRPRSLTEVLNLAVPLCLQNLPLLGRLSLVVLGPLAAAAVFLRIGAGWTWPALWLLIVPASFLAQGVFTVALGEALFRPPGEVRARAVLAQLARRSPAYLGGQLFRWVAMALGGLLILPTLLLAPAWLFLPEVVLLEGSPVGVAIRRSRALAEDHGLFGFGLWLATLLLPVLAALLAELLGGALLQYVLQLGQPLGSLWDSGGSGFAVFGLLAGTPCAAAARFLGYIDLRTRKEGWDIQLRFVSWAQREKLA